MIDNAYARAEPEVQPCAIMDEPGAKKRFPDTKRGEMNILGPTARQAYRPFLRFVRATLKPL